MVLRTTSSRFKIFICLLLLSVSALINFFTVDLFYSGYYSFAYYIRILAFTIGILVALSNVRQTKVLSFLIITIAVTELFFSLRIRSAHEPADIASVNFCRLYNPLFDKDTGNYNRLVNDSVDIFNGDSFGYGAGLTDPSQVFSHQVAMQLHHPYPTLFLATPGSEIYGQFKKMQPFNKPRLIVQQCYISDLFRPCTEAGYPEPDFTYLQDYPAMIRPIIRLSATSQYICFGKRQSATEKDYYGYMNRCADDTAVIIKLLAYTDTIVDYAASKNARLIFVLIPNPSHPEQSAVYMRSVKNHLQSLSVGYLDTTPLLAGIPFNERVISENDHHLNAKVHQQIAELLLKVIHDKPGHP